MQREEPSTYNVMDMGYVDYGGGPRPNGDTVDHAGMGHGSSGSGPVRSVADRVAMLHGGRVRWVGPVAGIDRSGDAHLDQFIHGRATGPIAPLR